MSHTAFFEDQLATLRILGLPHDKNNWYLYPSGNGPNKYIIKSDITLGDLWITSDDEETVQVIFMTCIQRIHHGGTKKWFQVGDVIQKAGFEVTYKNTDIVGRWFFRAGETSPTFSIPAGIQSPDIVRRVLAPLFIEKKS
jgi:hypothetical protein